MRHLRFLSLACIAALALAAPSYAASKGPAAGKAVKAGVIADVTGSAGSYGTSQKNAYELATDDMKSGLLDTGGANLTFAVEDPASDPNQVTNLMQKFTTDGTAIILGPTLSSEAKKADPIAVAAKIPVLATSNTAQGVTALGPCVYRDSVAEEQVVPDVVKKTMATWKYKTAAILYGDDDQFTKTDYDIYKEDLEKAGVKLVATETFHKKDVDFNAQLTRIKAANPDVIVIGALTAEATKILDQIQKLGLKSHLIGGNGFNSPEIKTLAGSAANGVVVGSGWFVGSTLGGNKSFVERYRKKFSKDPDQFAAQAYAGAEIVAHLARTGSITPETICSALKTGTFSTVLGKIGFDANRDVKAETIVVEIGNNGFGMFK